MPDDQLYVKGDAPTTDDVPRKRKHLNMSYFIAVASLSLIESFFEMSMLETKDSAAAAA